MSDANEPKLLVLPPPVADVANASVVQLLEELLVEARAGRIAGIALVAATPGSAAWHRWVVGDVGHDRLLGLIGLLERYVQDDVRSR